MYIGRYRYQSNSLIQEGEAKAMPPDLAVSGIHEPCIFVGDGALLYRDIIQKRVGGFASFVVGWSQLFGNVAFAAVSAIGFGMFIKNPVLGALIVIVVLTLLELKGITQVGKFEHILIICIIVFFFSLSE